VQSQAPRSLDDAIEFAFRYQLGDLEIAPIQIRSELRAFLLLLKEIQPRALLEIGTSRGGTLFLLARIAAPDAVLISVDLPTTDAGRFGGGDYAPRRRLYESFAIDQQRIRFLAADSHAAKTIAEVKRLLGEHKLDVLFVDGDHTTDGVRRDVELYGPLVREGGVIALHDIVEGPEDFVGGVPAFWQTLKDEDALELVEDPAQGGFGIGVLRP
jgi:predicted O-methyltransferase YrrM